MIDLTLTLYNMEDGAGDRFHAAAIDADTGEPIDVTDQYEVVAIQTPDGRTGFAVFKREALPVGDAAPGESDVGQPDHGGV